MKLMNFFEKLSRSQTENKSLVCVGLDTDPAKIPQFLLSEQNPIFTFNKAIIDATFDLVSAYKPQVAFYAAENLRGLESLIKTVAYIHEKYPTIPVILDAKRGDIGNTAEKYAQEVFDVIGVDAATVNPYLGFDSIEPFLQRKDKGIIILCRTSNPGAADFQDLKVDNKPLYQIVAQKIVSWHEQYGNCLMVVGATWPEQLKEVRQIAPNITFLVPGIGAQGGDVEKTVRAGLDKNGAGMIINSARGIIYASSGENFTQTARQETLKLREEINKYR
jgi:orotidine-5'-phosphate decarboxylase